MMVLSDIENLDGNSETSAYPITRWAQTGTIIPGLTGLPTDDMKDLAKEYEDIFQIDPSAALAKSVRFITNVKKRLHEEGETNPLVLTQIINYNVLVNKRVMERNKGGAIHTAHQGPKSLTSEF